MKITITMDNRETRTIENLVNKHAPIDQEMVKIENGHIARKFGIFDIKRTENSTDVSMDFDNNFTIEAMKFLDDISSPIIVAVKNLKFLFSGAKDRFAKWATDEEDIWKKIAKNLGEKSTDTKIVGLIKHKDWVQIDERTKKLDTIWSHRPINSEDDLANCLKEAGENEVRFVKVGHGDWHLEKSVSQVAKWVGDMFGTTEGKRVAK